MVFMALLVAGTSRAKEPDVNVTIGFGGMNIPPGIVYKFEKKGDQRISFSLHYRGKLVNSGVFGYQRGFYGFATDIINGFTEASLKCPVEKLDKLEDDLTRELTMSYGTRKTLVEMKFRGTLRAYSSFVVGSPKLKRVFKILSRNQPLMYRL